MSNLVDVCEAYWAKENAKKHKGWFDMFLSSRDLIEVIPSMPSMQDLKSIVDRAVSLAKPLADYCGMKPCSGIDGRPCGLYIDKDEELCDECKEEMARGGR